jgi:hypothetical protein
MSTLQISLLVIGALVVLAVYVFNLVQERRMRRRVESQFTPHEDVLLGDDAKGAPLRVEPSLRVTGLDGDTVVGHGGAPAAGSASPAGGDYVGDDAEGASVAVAAADVPASRPAAAQALAGGAVAVAPAEQPDADTELVVVFRLRAPMSSANFRADTRGEFGKALRWLGRRHTDEAWLPLHDDQQAFEIAEIAACLMLVDRDGPLSVAQLQTFLRMVVDRAGALPADVVLPKADEVLDKARALDRICADLDVQIGINLVKPEGAAQPTIPGTRLRGVAEAAGFRLGNRGVFEYWSEDVDLPLFSLQSQRGESLSAESLRSLQPTGLTLLLDVPRTPDAVKAFDQMRAIAKRLAATLEAILVDDNRKPLSDAALGTIRSQVHETVAAMRASHIEPGSGRALRLFH